MSVNEIRIHRAVLKPLTKMARFLCLVGCLIAAPIWAQTGSVKSHQKISDLAGNFTGVIDDFDEFAIELASIGDIDNDGVTDLAVGALQDDDGGTDRGAVWILFLNSDGTVKNHQKISDTVGNFTGTLDDGDSFGTSVTSMGDLDGDSVTDLAVGAWSDDDGGNNRGAVWILFMNTNGTVKSHQKISSISGNFAGPLVNSDEFSDSTSNLGDLDSDGVNDLAVGAAGDDDGGSARGAIWILFLNNDGTVKSHQKISDLAGSFTGTLDDNDQFGLAAAAPGDIDKDGVNDLVVGANQDDDGGTDRGAVWVLFLNSDGTVKSHQKISDTTGGITAGLLGDTDRFGISVGALGDVDGDTVPDIAVGAFQDDDGGPNRGAAYVLLLKTDGTAKKDQKISDTQGNFTATINNSEFFGRSVNGIGDLDNDGINDMVVGEFRDTDGGPNRGAVFVLFLNRADFTELGEAAGIDGYGWGNGVAWGDYDNDGDIDVFVGYENTADLLYRNNNNGTFTEVGSSAGVDGGVLKSHGASWGDYDNDGDLDLFVTRWLSGTNLLHRNNGNSTFTEVASASGVTATGTGVGVSWVDFDRDGDLDIFIPNWGAADRLYQNDGTGSFFDAAPGAGVDFVGNPSDGVFIGAGVDFVGNPSDGVFIDYDNDHDMDFYLSRIGANRLYSNDGDRTFTEVAAAAGVDDVNQGGGSAWADYDNDGDPDLYVPNRNPANNNLYRNDSDGTFTDVAAAAGVDDASFGQGAAWADFDSDGDLDVVVTNVTSAGRTYRNNGNGTFTDIAIVAGIDGGGSATGTSWADYDGDGDLDLFIARELAPNHLFRNNGNSNNWMGVKLAGTVAGKSGIGSIVSVFSGAASYRRDVSGGSGYHGSQPSQIQTFGLGGTSMVDSIKVWWATGHVQVESNVSVNQVTTITEPALNTVINVGVSTANALFIGWIDYDGDSDLDIHVSPGGGATPKLYRNDGAGSFTDVAASVNLTETDQPLGIGWGDYDSDGDPDLYLALNGVNRLHRNDGATFTSVGAAAGVDDNGVGYTGLWGDYDNDGDRDIHVANYAGANPDRLYRNDGSGTFSEVGNAAGVDDTGNGRASSWADYDDDGDLDLYLARDGQANRLYRNQGDLTFTDVAGNAGVNVDHAGRGTGSVWADYDNDGDLDLYLTNQDAGVGNALYRNEGSGQFKEIAAAVGVKDEAPTRSPGWTSTTTGTWISTMGTTSI